ncbi:MAG TPA: UDPGP type 1 family protein [Phycisphaerae bacterium]|nr:UDPGP type 1 family protein [Phycisphaerae bacterium]HNU45634.1 UDPGP type 1 family protein [Phycisphaerae bacterium]
MVITGSRPIERRYQTCLAALSPRGQDHVLRWFPELNPAQQAQLLDDIESIPWDLVEPLLESHVRQVPPKVVPANLEPAPVWSRAPGSGQKRLYAEALELGRQMLKEGKVAVLTVAGGQGTRLGFDGPKGEVVVTPSGGLSLFGLFAAMLATARDRYDAPIPWYIMTSPENHERTEAYFQQQQYFGLPPEDICFFAQGMLPAFDFQGRLLLAQKHRLALAPDGHGGTLRALVENEALLDMHDRGIDIISYFQVDNPLVKPFDPLFIGLHAQAGSDMSTKVCAKADDHEKVGNVCLHDGEVVVIEYTDFPDEYATARTPDGRRKFDAGNLAIHLLDTWFVDRIVGQTFQLPFRRAEKAVPFVDEFGSLQMPTTPNAVKLETFIFDALPLADHALVLEVDRAEEFSPVKNATGVDSLEWAQRDQVRRACRWLEAAGVHIPRRPDGEPDCTVVIAPSFALDAEDVRERRSELPSVVEPGGQLYLS